MGFLKNFGKELIGGVGSIASSALGGILGSSAQSSANKANKEIAQMNNEYNERMLQKQMDYNTSLYDKQKQDNIEMWQMQNEYNSPANQRKLREEAGLNPYMGEYTSTASAMSSPGAQGINPPTASPYNYQANTHMATAVGQGFEKFLNSYMAYRTHKEQLKQLQIDNQYRAAQAISKISNMKADTYNKTTQAALNQTNNSLAGAIAQANINYTNEKAESEKVSRQLVKQQMATEAYNTLIREKDFQTYGERFAKDISEQVARIALLRSNDVLTKREAEHELEKMWTTSATRQGINLQNRKNYRTLEAQVWQAYVDVVNSGIGGITDIMDSFVPWNKAPKPSRLIGTTKQKDGDSTYTEYYYD